MRIIEMKNGSYGVEHEGKMIVENESMGVCDAVVFAHLHPPKHMEDMTEGREITEGRG